MEFTIRNMMEQDKQEVLDMMRVILRISRSAE